MSQLMGAVLALAAAWSLAVPTMAAESEFEFDRVVPDARAFLEAARESLRDAPAAEVEAGPAAAREGIERRIVVFKRGFARPDIAAIVGSGGGELIKDLRLIQAGAVAVAAADAAAFDAAMRANKQVARVERDFVQNWLAGASARAPSPGAEGWWPFPWPWRPKPPKQSFPWGIERVNARAAWSATRGGGVKVAVVDTGIESHPDLRVAGGFNAIEAGASYADDHGHGTHVAGTIAALDNPDGVIGVAPEASVYAVKVLSKNGSGTFADIIEGLQWCAENGIRVANLSLGASQGTQALQEAVAAATSAGVAVIAAAGNSGGAVGFPGAYPEAIAVAASDSSGKTASFSSRGPEVDLIAPGVAVNSTYKGGKYKEMSGTSMATPHVAGLAVLAIGSRGPADVAALRRMLTEAARPLEGVPPEQQGAGFIDAGRLVGGS